MHHSVTIIGMKRDLILIVHNVRSSHNVGSLLRTAEGLGVEKVYLTGYTPYPQTKNDDRLPHISQKLTRQIHKTALGAETMVAWEHHKNIEKLLQNLKKRNYRICAVEQTATSVPLPNYRPEQKVALIVGREVQGLEQIVLDQVQQTLEIPMLGKKESFNVAQAAAIALYHCRFL